MGALAAFGVFVALNGSSVATAASRAHTIAPAAAALGAGLSVLAMANRGRLNHLAHAAVGLRVPFASTVRASAVAFTANKVARSAGVSGLAVFVRHGRRHRLAAPAVVAAGAVATASCFAALGLALVAAFAVVAAQGDLQGWWLAAAAGYGVTAAGLTALLLVALHRGDALDRLCRLPARLRRRPRPRCLGGTGASDPDRAGLGFGRLGDGPAEAEAAAWADVLRTALRRAGTNRSATAGAVAHATASKVIGALLLATSVAAVGPALPLSTVLVAYGASLAAASASILPGGLGAVEASLGGVLASAGLSPSSAVLAVALYRIFDLWLPVAVGAVLGRGELRRPRTVPAENSRATHPLTALAPALRS